jgi:hypothetical protein
LPLLALAVAVLGAAGLAPRPSRAADAPAGPKTRGGRVLGLALSEPERGGHDAALRLARSIGVTETSISLAWDDLEPEPGVFKSRWVEIARAYYPTRGVDLTVVVHPIDTTADRRPKALRGKPWDDPAVVDRYTAVVLWTLDGLKGVPLACLSLGNEVDVLLGADAKAWTAYTRLVREVRRRVKAEHRDLVVGVKVTAPALLAEGPARGLASAADLDAVFATYYPLGDHFRVRDPATVAATFAGLVAAAGPKPLWLLEVGCPSGEACGSTPDLQRRFVEAVFAAWDTHAAKIPVLSFCWMHDQPAAAVDGMTAYYGLASPAFRAFLGTLGLRDREGEGRDKPAFTALAAAAKARGFVP